jgi:hypothetical protein
MNTKRTSAIIALSMSDFHTLRSLNKKILNSIRRRRILRIPWQYVKQADQLVTFSGRRKD